MDATHLTSMACKVSATDCSDAGSGKRRGRQVKPLGANGCLVMGSLGFFFFFFFWVGELLITHTWTCNERNHKCQTEGHPQPKLQATLTTWVEADTKVCKEATCQAKQAAHKAVVHQPTAKPVHFLQTKHHLCLNQPRLQAATDALRAGVLLHEYGDQSTYYFHHLHKQRQQAFFFFFFFFFFFWEGEIFITRSNDNNLKET